MDSLYLALGDSITTGYGVGLNNSFASIYYDILRAASPGLAYANLGIDGLTSGTLATILQKRKYRTFLPEARLISLTIGSNDLIAIGKGFLQGKQVNIPALMQNLTQNLMYIGSLLRSINPSGVVKISTVYNPLHLASQYYSTQSQNLIIQANEAIASCAWKYNLIVVPVHAAFRGREQELLGPDYLHPNLVGHRVIAKLFASI